jgi:hypothetical protein
MYAFKAIPFFKAFKNSRLIIQKYFHAFFWDLSIPSNEKMELYRVWFRIYPRYELQFQGFEDAQHFEFFLENIEIGCLKPRVLELTLLCELEIWGLWQSRPCRVEDAGDLRTNWSVRQFTIHLKFWCPKFWSIAKFPKFVFSNPKSEKKPRKWVLSCWTPTSHVLYDPCGVKMSKIGAMGGKSGMSNLGPFKDLFESIIHLWWQNTRNH